MDYNNYTNEQLLQFVEETSDYNEMDHALNELMKRSSAKAFDLGMDILINDKGDQFLQASVWSTCYDYDNIYTVMLMNQRCVLMGWSLIETVLLSMYNYDASLLPSNFKNLIIDSYNNMPKEKKVEFSGIFKYFLDNIKKARRGY